MEFTLKSIISAALKVPGVKVERTGFLTDFYKNTNADLAAITEEGPFNAGVSVKDADALVLSLIMKRTGISSTAAFFAGIPGGLAYAATIPADLVQFFGTLLRLSQEIVYAYGGADLLPDGGTEDDYTNALTVLLGVMYGIDGAASAMRLQLSGNGALIPEAVDEGISKAITSKALKSSVTKSVSKVVPVLGGLVSGGCNLAEMLPMAQKLANTVKAMLATDTVYTPDADIANVESLAATGSFAYEDLATGVVDKIKNNETINNVIGKGKDFFKKFMGTEDEDNE